MSSVKNYASFLLKLDPVSSITYTDIGCSILHRIKYNHVQRAFKSRPGAAGGSSNKASARAGHRMNLILTRINFVAIVTTSVRFLETDADAETAASYLSSCFVRRFSVYGHHCAFSKNAIIAAPELIRELDFCRCIFHNAAENTLGKTLDGSTFQSLSLVRSSIPGITQSRKTTRLSKTCNHTNFQFGKSSMSGWSHFGSVAVTRSTCVLTTMIRSSK